MEIDTPMRWCAARLLNHSELTAALGLSSGASDDQVVAAAVARWGADAPQRLHGAFAYALDTADGAVAITRDALGQMPVFWVRDAAGDVRVSDSLSVLANVDGVDTSPDDEFLAADSLRVPGVRADRTAMAGVHRVPPGCTVRVRGGHSVVERWWHPERTTAEQKMDIATAAAELRHLLVSVVDEHVAMVERRTGGDGAHGVAAHCSAGLDSTVVAVLAARSLEGRGRRLRRLLSWSPDRSFDPSTVVGSDIAYDERDLLERLADELGVPVEFPPPATTEAPWLADLDPAVFPRSTVRRESWLAPRYADMVATYVLSGWGGDEFASFNGRGSNCAAVRRLRWQVLWDSYTDRRGRGHGRLRSLASTVAPGLPDWTPGVRRRRRISRSESRIAREAAARENHPHVLAASDALRRRLFDPPNPRALQLALLDLDHLSRRVDAWHQIGLRWGHEYGYPLLDRRIVEWSLCLPPEMFRIGDHSRRVFRQAVVDIVPDDIRLSEKLDPVLFSALA